MTYLSENDLPTILTIFVNKGFDKHWRAKETCRQFPNKNWKLRSVNGTIKPYEDTGSIFRHRASGRPATFTTDEKQDTVECLALFSPITKAQRYRNLHFDAIFCGTPGT